MCKFHFTNINKIYIKNIWQLKPLSTQNEQVNFIISYSLYFIWNQIDGDNWRNTLFFVVVVVLSMVPIYEKWSDFDVITFCILLPFRMNEPLAVLINKQYVFNSIARYILLFHSDLCVIHNRHIFAREHTHTAYAWRWRQMKSGSKTKTFKSWKKVSHWFVSIEL